MIKWLNWLNWKKKNSVTTKSVYSEKCSSVNTKDLFFNLIVIDKELNNRSINPDIDLIIKGIAEYEDYLAIFLNGNSTHRISIDFVRKNTYKPNGISLSDSEYFYRANLKGTVYTCKFNFNLPGASPDDLARLIGKGLKVFIDLGVKDSPIDKKEIKSHYYLLITEKPGLLNKYVRYYWTYVICKILVVEYLRKVIK